MIMWLCGYAYCVESYFVTIVYILLVNIVPCFGILLTLNNLCMLETSYQLGLNTGFQSYDKQVQAKGIE